MIDKLQLEQVTSDLGWIRKLAHALVNSDADDLAQEAWLVAADEMPADRPPRRWLARVTTNLARMRGRSATRRRAREAASLAPEAAPSPADLVERVQLQRMVAGEVVALDEPYRSTLLLHYFEGMTSAEIARLHGVSDGTVRWRLKGALDAIRDSLREREDSPKGGWLAMLAPLARPIGHQAPAEAVSGATVFTFAAVAAVVAVALIVIASWSHPDDEVIPTTSTAEAIGRVFPAPGTPDPASAHSRDPSVFAQPEAPNRHVAGTVTSHGAALAGATVRIGVVVGSHRDTAAFGNGATAELVAETTTGRDGRFDFGELPPAAYTIVAATPALAPASLEVTLGDPTLHADQLALALDDCQLRLHGVVRDAAQHPIPRARATVANLASVEAASDGTYALCVRAETPVRVSADGFASVEVTPAGRGDITRDFELAPATAIVGTVVDAQGGPIAGARIVATATAWQRHADMFATEHWSIADDDGRYSITGLAAGEYDLVAVHPGSVDSESRTVSTRTARRTEARLVLRTGAEVRGVVTRAGHPVAGVSVLVRTWGTIDTTAVSQTDGTFVIDGVPFGAAIIDAGGVYTRHTIDHRDVKVEVKLDTAGEISGYVRRDGHPVAGARVECINEVVFARNAAVTTDRDGRYSCSGVSHGVTVIASADCNGRATSSRPVKGASTTDVELASCPAATNLHVRGDVATRGGSPFAAAEVWFSDGSHTSTDSAGRFELDLTAGATPRVYQRGHMASYLLGDGAREGAPVIDDRLLHLVVTGDPTTAVGHVADRDGNPVAARVTVRCGPPLDRWDSDASHTALTRADGWFSVTNVVVQPDCVAHVFTGTETETIPWTGAFLDITVGAPRPAQIRLRYWSQPPIVTARSITSGVVVTAAVHGAIAELADIVPGWYEIAADDGEFRAVDTVRLGDANSSPLLARWLAPDQAREHTIRIVDLDTDRPVMGMACELPSGAGNVVALSDAAGNVSFPQDGTAICWSSRGPSLPASESVDGVLSVVLERPGTANAGFVVGPESPRLVVAAVDPDGAASTAGLHTGDRVVELDGKAVSQLSPRELMYLVWTHASGTMRVGVERGGALTTIAIAIR
jgi:RNA polymerase sigma-70 factor (ECF subfamily)